MKQAHVFISGSVQGVGCRQFVKMNAQKFGVTGWVRNTEDGGVEAVFQSSGGSDQEEKKKIEEMMVLCRKGPFLAEVKQFGFEWEDGQESLTDFVVI